MRRYQFCMILCICILVLCPCFAFAQEQAVTEESQKPNVFLDRFRRYETHIRDEISQINYVRDPRQAEIYVLLTQQQTGGGEEFTVTFTGQETFQGINDTLRFVSRQDETENERRDTLVKLLKIGLVRYLVRTDQADAINVNLGERRRGTRRMPENDKWNFWVFRLNASADLEGEENDIESNFSGGITANRITDAWKINIRFRPEYTERRTDTEEEIFKTYRRENRFNGLFVKSITNHWSTGLIAEVISDTRINTNLAVSAAAALEYNIFPYSMSTRRQFTFRLGIWGNKTKYKEETIFNKTQEDLYYSTFSIGTEVIERWGQIDSTIEGKLYFHDTEFNKLDWNTRIDIRIFRGLSFNIFGRVSLIHDQLYISKGDAEIDEILLKQTQLLTSWSYNTRFGFSYLFGSPYNNVVNSRFDGVGGNGRRDH
ncbi:MAG: hypothetical protein GY863_21270 [bacterium]|nr:hypothetical protein [bacterium]